ncbi:MAG: hypothetical protein K6C36_09720 [Clostridia bacterium]|nr:hypothetical protein [Clostridia bacterium]
MQTCPNCKAELGDNELVCRYCGAALQSAYAQGAQFYAPPAAPAPGAGTVGFSDLVDSEEVRKALKKNDRISSIVLIVFDILPFVCMLIYGAVSPKIEIGMAAAYGLVFSVFFGIITVIVTVRRKLAKSFTGTVSDKKIAHSMSGSGTGRARTKCVIRVQCDDGKTRKKSVNMSVYDYLEIGEKVRYLPRFPQPFEKYDKTVDGNVLCMFCSRRNPLTETVCSHCRKPLIK